MLSWGLSSQWIFLPAFGFRALSSLTQSSTVAPSQYPHCCTVVQPRFLQSNCHFRTLQQDSCHMEGLTPIETSLTALIKQMFASPNITSVNLNLKPLYIWSWLKRDPLRGDLLLVNTSYFANLDQGTKTCWKALPGWVASASCGHFTCWQKCHCNLQFAELNPPWAKSAGKHDLLLSLLNVVNVSHFHRARHCQPTPHRSLASATEIF